ncbi:MAG: SDR family NAD(P)-dependent oxidoreductase [Terriglobales bacterium]
MKDGLSGKVAVITGGSGAIGAAVLRAFQDEGATAISFDIAPGAGHPWIACDVRSDESVADAIRKVKEQYDRIDIAIHAAGISRDAVVWKLSVDDWDAVQQVNLRGAFLLTRHVVPLMRANQGGSIVFIGSINGSRGKFGAAAYSASKAGLLGFAKSLARETGKFGVRVNVIEPGWVRTPLTEAVREEVRNRALAESLVGSFVEPSDIASVAVFLCSNVAQRITGQVLRVDGGQFLGPT